MTATAAKFEVTFDPQARLLRWTMRGFWSLNDVPPFAEAMRAAIAGLGPPPRRYDGLSDALDFPVQTADVGGALLAFERKMHAERLGRLALVVGSTMNKLQVQRIFDLDNMGIFFSVPQAEAWLREPFAGE